MPIMLYVILIVSGLLHLFGYHGAITLSQAHTVVSCARGQRTRFATQAEDGSGLSPHGDGPTAENCLESALANISSDTTILLASGHHVIEKFILVRDVQNITLELELESEKVDAAAHILCHYDEKDFLSPDRVSGAGLMFFNVSGLSIRNVVIDGCGFTGMELMNSVELLNSVTDFFFTIPTSVRISIFIGHCEHTVMENVTIMNTRGFGLVGVNMIGASKLKNVHLYNNTNPGNCRKRPQNNVFTPSISELYQYDSLGGAAVFMYFDYLPEIQDLRERYQGSHFNLELENCNFTLNSECSLNYLNLLRSPGRGDSSLVIRRGYTLGGSGALAITLAQLDYGVTVKSTFSFFNDNSGTFGSGSIIALFTGIRNSHVIFDNCRFSNSSIAFFNDVCQPVRLGSINPDFINRNVSFSVLGSSFTDTIEVNAGSTLLIYSNYFTSVVNNSINVYIDKCHFKNNRATVGSAMAIYEYKINGFSEGMQIFIRDTDFVENEVITVESEVHDVVIAVSPSASTVSIRNVNLTLQGNCSFVDNIGTGLQAESSLIGIDGNVTFLRNVGTNGGGLSLVLYSYLIMNRNASLYFLQNEARSGGGAMYINENGFGSYLVGGYVDCFLHFTYDNFIVCENCSDLNSYGVYFKFSDNVATYAGDLLFGSSLVTCPWAHELTENNNFNRSIFAILTQEYPNIFEVEPQQPRVADVVQSMSARLEIESNETPLSADGAIEVFPGQTFSLSVSALDDFNHTVANIITAFATVDASRYDGSLLVPLLGSTNFAVLERDRPTSVPVRILGSEDQNISLVIYSTDSAGRAQRRLDITLLSCGFGFIFDYENNTCLCDYRITDRINNGISCDTVKHVTTVETGAWIGPFENETVVDRCLFTYCQPGRRDIYINSDDKYEIDFNVQCKEQTNRVGFLCSECKEGFSAVLGTRNCLRCSNWYIFLFIFFIVIGIVAIIVIQCLNITITVGFINGAIFYSNIVSIHGDAIVPGEAYNEALALISFPTLSLGFETCLYDGLTNLWKVLWQLSFPVYLFMLMIFIILLARSKYVKLKQWVVGSSTVRTFATLLVLCYVSVLSGCTELIAFNRIYTIERSFFLQWRGDPSVRYFGIKHAIPGLAAYLVVVVYIIPLPFLSLCPALLYSNKYTSKFKPLYDAFWDPYKPRYRYFIGLQLMIRWLSFSLVAAVRPPTNIFVTDFILILLLLVQCTLQPYRENWQNYVDSAFSCNLVLLLTGSLFFWSQHTMASSTAERVIIARQSLIYTNVLIVLGFLMMLCIIGYHVYLRFPRIEKCLNMVVYMWKSMIYKDSDRMKKETNCTAAPKTAEQPDTPSNEQVGRQTSTVDPTTSQIILPTIYTVELREPLLESGTVSLHAVDSSD